MGMWMPAPASVSRPHRLDLHPISQESAAAPGGSRDQSMIEAGLRLRGTLGSTPFSSCQDRWVGSAFAPTTSNRPALRTVVILRPLVGTPSPRAQRVAATDRALRFALVPTVAVPLPEMVTRSACWPETSRPTPPGTIPATNGVSGQ